MLACLYYSMPGEGLLSSAPPVKPWPLFFLIPTLPFSSGFTSLPCRDPIQWKGSALFPAIHPSS